MLGSIIQTWLDQQCSLTAGAAGGVVLLFTSKAARLVPAAVWPQASRGEARLTAAAKIAFEKDRAVLQASNPGAGEPSAAGAVISHPLRAKGRTVGAVALMLSPGSVVHQETISREVERRAASFEALFAQPKQPVREPTAKVLEFLATVLSHEHFSDSAAALAVQLAAAFQSDRVSIGFVRSRYVKVEALSLNADFRERQSLLRDIAAAMDECVDQAATVQCPQPAGDKPRITHAHAELARKHGNATSVSVPLIKSGVAFGAITFERNGARAFDAEAIALIEHVACLCAPVLDLKRASERSTLAVLGDRLRKSVAGVFGTSHPVAKLVAACIVGGIIGVAAIHGEYRVGANARLEGSIQRVLVAPTEGYLKQVHVRPGDAVKPGQVLAELADEDLKLERRKWESEVAQYENAYGEALAKQDRAQIVMSQAHIEEARAQLALADEKLARGQIRAPFEGIVIKGDLTQSLGAPLKRGDLLLTIAPSAEYRVILEVDERDVGDLRLGQSGRLALAALPGESLPIKVRRITPVASTEEGRHYFEVEAEPMRMSANLRPGLKGVAKIEAGERSLLWIWTHHGMDWLRLKLWSWIG